MKNLNVVFLDDPDVVQTIKLILRRIERNPKNQMTFMAVPSSRILDLKSIDLAFVSSLLPGGVELAKRYCTSGIKTFITSGDEHDRYQAGQIGAHFLHLGESYESHTTQIEIVLGVAPHLFWNEFVLT